MADSSAEFANVTNLRAEALGEPGQRTFRVLVDSSNSSAVIWLEKEQLFQLALALNQLLANLSEESGGPGVPEQAEESSPVHVEFKVGKLVLGHDNAKDKIVIDAHDLESGEDAPPTVRVWSDKVQVTAFTEEALREVAGGRPICPLCRGPIDPTGHQCPRSNGHWLEVIEGL